MGNGAAPHDPKTVKYFDEHAPEYSTERLAVATDMIQKRAREGASLVDLGCGAGNTLAHMLEVTPVTDALGVDVSENLLKRCEELAGCPTMLGSIVDPDLPARIGRKFDFAVVAAVLHHLIGPTRKASRAYAGQAIRNALAVLEPGGHLVILEPIFAPRLAMDGVFWIKKAVTSVTSKRVFFGEDNYWTNIGEPVVSYYGAAELEGMVEAEGAQVVERYIEPESMGKLDLVLDRSSTTLVATPTAR